jgi:putative transposase
MHTYREDYHRKLPHIQPLGGTFFVTYRLHGALPVNVRRELLKAFEVAKHRLALENKSTPNALDELHRRYYARFDAVLDKTMYGPSWLRNEGVAELVAKTLQYWDTQRIDLIAFCIMPNHVHSVFTLLDVLTESGQPNALDRFMHSVKGYSAGRANRLLQREGSFWEEETYDRLVRDDAELVRIVQYILNNPVKAGLCEQWSSWKWNYVKAEYNMF